jgi:predicted AlkP superfamily phosphohydrolase/phosphomutase
MQRRGRRAGTAGRLGWVLLLGGLLAGASTSCLGPAGDRAKGPVWLVIGVDGADWGVIDALWKQGRLPHLKALAERGVAGSLATDYGASPVIWTTVATGVVPGVHGITGFAVPTPEGDVPVSSRLRKVPALWNMLTTAGRRTAVVSWWASWPAERIAGVVISDRAEMAVGDTVSPPELEPRFADWVERSKQEANLFDPRLTTQERDHLTQFVARQLLDVDFDLVMVYFRGVDIACHRYWKYWEPQAFRDVDPQELAELRGMVPGVYEATDAAIGRLVEKAGADTNVMVLSDHGFHAQKREEIRIMLDFDEILLRLGFQGRGADGGIDWDATDLYTFATAKFRLAKRVRYADRVAPTEREALRRRLTRELATVTWAGGQPAFQVRDAGNRERRTGADFVVDVVPRGASHDLRHGERLWHRVVGEITSLSGAHGRHTSGVFFAAGPDVDPAASLDGISVHDIAPTLLYGLGLPVGEDFAGSAWQELFTESYRGSRPLRTIPTWGTLGDGEALASAADEEILDDLRALGYID